MKQSGTTNKEEVLGFRITTEAREKLEAKAEKNCMSLAGYIRQNLYALIDYVPPKKSRGKH